MLQTELSKLPVGRRGHERQIRCSPQDAVHETVEEAGSGEDEDGVVAELEEAETDAPRRHADDPLDEHRQGEEDVEDDGLHGVEPDEAVEDRVADDAEVEGEEGHEARVGEGAIGGDDGEQRGGGGGRRREAGEEEAGVVEGVEEREGVGQGGQESVRGRHGRSVGRRYGVRSRDGADRGRRFEAEGDLDGGRWD